MATLKVSDISISISGNRILNNLSLEIGQAEIVGLIGPNGSGKTTLFNCISGFLRADAGKIQLGDTELSDLLPHERAKLGLGRVFQIAGVFRDMTLLENLYVALEAKGTLANLFFGSCNKLRTSAMEYLAQIGLENRANAKASSLSGGQLRLLEIARSLASGAQVFLLDEPTAGVSPKMKDQVSSLIIKLRSLGKSVLVIEHDINFIQSFCNRIAVVNLGNVVLDGTPGEVRSSALLKEIYFGGS